MKTRVINLVGASGTGKTTIAKELEKTGYNVIQSYTTRPPRHKGEWGHTFIEEYDVYKNDDKIMINDISNTTLHYKHDMIAYFNSYNSGHHYFATDEQVIRGKDNIYIVDPNGAEMVKDYYKDTDVEVITIFLQVDKEVRKERLAKRSGIDLGDALNLWLEFKDVYAQDELNKIKALSEIGNRLRKDDNIFGVAKCDYVVSANNSLDITTEWIREVLEQ